MRTAPTSSEEETEISWPLETTGCQMDRVCGMLSRHALREAATVTDHVVRCMASASGGKKTPPSKRHGAGGGGKRTAGRRPPPTKGQSQLEEVGKFETRRIGRYAAAQCFLHRVFAYRGITLFPWKAQVADRNEKLSPKPMLYYQVLMDERDTPHVKTQPEVGKFARKMQSRFGLQGLDHVCHDDLMPYRPSERRPIRHHAFERFFSLRKERGRRHLKVVPKLSLHDWRRRHLPWLAQTQVHRLTTEKVRITAMAFYMGRRSLTHWWRYSIRIENLGTDSVILQGQRWGIYTGNGELQTVRGIGILGQLPVLSPQSPALQYSSHVSLLAPRGHMWGYYLVQRQPAGRTFLCPVPSFPLESTLAPDPLKTVAK